MQRIRSSSAFTLVEMIVGITIFSIGLLGVGILFQTAIDAATYSRHEIIAGNLLREQIELVKNLRDSNWRSFREWNLARITDPTTGGEETTNLTGGTYMIENNFTTSIAFYNNEKLSNIPVRITRVDDIPTKGTEIFSNILYQKLRLCLNPKHGYVHNCTDPDNTPTEYASYLEIKPLMYNDSEPALGSGFILIAHVIVGNGNSARDYDMKTILTDWKR